MKKRKSFITRFIDKLVAPEKNTNILAEHVYSISDLEKEKEKIEEAIAKLEAKQKISKDTELLNIFIERYKTLKETLEKQITNARQLLELTQQKPESTTIWNLEIVNTLRGPVPEKTNEYSENYHQYF